MQRISIFGGTFDPIHRGHLQVAEEASMRLGLDQLIFVPAGEPWQKAGRVSASAQARADMVQLAIAENPRFALSRCEVERKGESVTVDTLEYFRAQYPAAELFFLLGADALEGVTTWKQWQRNFEYATFVALTRPGSATLEQQEQARRLYHAANAENAEETEVHTQTQPSADKKHSADKENTPQHRDYAWWSQRIQCLDVSAVDLSSTDIRARCAQGQSIAGLLPRAVHDYIERHGLYAPQP